MFGRSQVCCHQTGYGSEPIVTNRRLGPLKVHPARHDQAPGSRRSTQREPDYSTPR